MNLNKYQKIVFIGIGGTGAYYIAKFFLALNKEVIGYDIHNNERTQELEKLGAKIIYINPKGSLTSGTSLFIYSPALPNELLQKLQAQNPNIENFDTGSFVDNLINMFNEKKLSKEELIAFKESEIAPLFSFDQSTMKFIGVTGTDGKTSTSTMIYHLLSGLGFKPGLISTVSAKIGDKELDTGLHTTTPTSQELAKLLKLMKKENCTHVILETTSHALAMGRLAGLKFDAVVYTNITSEHLDYHKDKDHYFQSKTRLIKDHCSKKGFAVLNADDTEAFSKLSKIANRQNIKTYSYGIRNNSDLKAKDVLETSDGISFSIAGEKIEIPILGKYNVLNALATITVVTQLENIRVSEIYSIFKTFKTVIGRMQVIQQTPFTVIVDFAHTAFAFESALKSCQELKANKKNKLIVVFGAAGKRDPTKRIPMGKNAGKLADITIITAEDPRWEKLKNINDDIEKGWKAKANKSIQQLIRFDDESLLTDVRKNAIEMAIKLAQPGDIVLIAGKAHEQSLCFGDVEYPWNDIDETEKLIKKYKSKY